MQEIKTVIKLIGKAFRFTLQRPIQRYNVANRAKKYLGPEAKHFMPAPRAIGSLADRGGKPSQYPHLEGKGFFSLRQRRLESLNRDREQDSLLVNSTDSRLKELSGGTEKSDYNLIIEASNKLSIIKTVTKLDLDELKLTLDSNKSPEDEMHTTALDDPNRETNQINRPLPKLTNVQNTDPQHIWSTDKVPPGKISLNMLQELMLNKLADDEYWTGERIAERYNIKEVYAENLTKYLTQIKFVLSPRVAHLLDYIARDDPLYKATKDKIYYVDPHLRTKEDRKYDDTFLDEDDIGDDLRRLIGFKTLDKSPPKFIMQKPEPLRIDPMNKSKQEQVELELKKKLQSPERVKKLP